MYPKGQGGPAECEERRERVQDEGGRQGEMLTLRENPRGRKAQGRKQGGGWRKRNGEPSVTSSASSLSHVPVEERHGGGAGRGGRVRRQQREGQREGGGRPGRKNAAVTVSGGIRHIERGWEGVPENGVGQRRAHRVTAGGRAGEEFSSSMARRRAGEGEHEREKDDKKAGETRVEEGQRRAHRATAGGRAREGEGVLVLFAEFGDSVVESTSATGTTSGAGGGRV
ncbi:hypothetical protein B0H14DRAFT_2653293 [Mycena olivaceomarginata]|nr:hypothetical protein B0H14DRAFT_2653293 [Mycena olivaceomarginata]